MNELPRGWTQARLDEVAEVRLGRQRSPKNHSGQRMRPYMRAANVTWDGLDLDDVKQMNFTEDESAVYELREGDILVAEASGSADEVGRPALWRGEIKGCCFQNTLVRVRTRGVVAEYLRCFLLSEARAGRIGRASPGVGIHHIGNARLAAWQVPVPPVAEQRRIVAAIEEQISRLDAGQVGLSSVSVRLAAARRSAVAEAMRETRWPRKRISEIGDGSRNELAIGPFGSNLKVSDYRVSGVPLIFVRNIRAREFSTTRFISFEKAKELAAHTVRPNDVLITKMGEPPGDAAVYPEGRPDAVLTADCIKISLGADFDPRFVALALEAPDARRQVLAITKGVAQKKVSLGRFKGVTIPAPPRGAQRRIADDLEGAFESLLALQHAVRGAEQRSAALRNAVLAAAFRGELVPQDPNDEPASVLLERIAAERSAAPVKPRRRRVPAGH